MRILVVLSRIPYPLDKGDKLRAFNQIKLLAKQHEITLFCLNDAKIHKDAINQLTPYCKKMVFYNLSRFKIFFRLLAGLFSKEPLQVNYFYQKKAQKKLDRLIEETVPKHIYCQLIRCSKYVEKYTIIPRTIDFMDALSAGIERRIEKVPFYLKPIFQLEAKRLKLFEKNTFDKFDNKTIISKQDQQLINHPHKSDIEIVVNGIDTDFFHPKKSEKKYDLVFTGNMSYPPNIEGALYISKKIWPLLANKYPDLKILIAGANPPGIIKNLSSKNIEVTGWIDDIRDAYASSKVFIAPMQIGTGLQNKLLEAMAMQLPCITSPLANNALNAQENYEILIGNSPEEYAQHIQLLLSNNEKANNIAQNGFQLVTSKFNWTSSTQKLANIIRETRG